MASEAARRGDAPVGEEFDGLQGPETVGFLIASFRGGDGDELDVLRNENP